MNNSWSDVLRLGSWGAGSAVVVVLVVGQPFCNSNCVCKLSVFYALPQPKAFATSIAMKKPVCAGS